ncbi:MAG: NTP transferase domain-containing protein [Cytophagales bacterium]|nr:NTP transferase domain-containing protein [Armatimonadota bacterium]
MGARDRKSALILGEGAWEERDMRAKRAVITAAGRGTRQFPATRSIQKELLPLVDTDGLTKPTIQIIVEDCLRSGIEEVCIVVEKDGQKPFREHFRALGDDERRVFAAKPWALAAGEALAEMERRITYVEQPSPEGFGHAVYQARSFVGDQPFLLLLGDHVYTTPDGVSSPIAQLLDIAAESGGAVTSVRLDPESAVSVTGVLKCRPLNSAIAADAPGQVYDILALKEKPTIIEARELATPGVPGGFYLCHFGLHLFTPEIFDCLGQLIETNTRVKNEFQLTSGQELLLARSQRGEAPPYRAAFLQGDRWDTGVPDGYLETLMALGGRGPFAAQLHAPVR